MKRFIVLAVLVLAIGCKKKASLQVLKPGGTATYADDKTQEAKGSLELGAVVEAKIPRDGVLPSRVQLETSGEWIDSADVIIVPATPVVRYAAARGITLQPASGEKKPIAYGSELRLLKAEAPYAVLDDKGLFTGFLDAKNVKLGEVAPTAEERLAEARRILIGTEPLSAAKELLAGASDDAGKAILAGLERFDQLASAPARSGPRTAPIPGDTTPMLAASEKMLAYVRVPTLQLKTKEGSIDLAFGDAVIVDKVQGELAKVAIEPGELVQIEDGGKVTGVAKTAVTLAIGTGALDANEQDSGILLRNAGTRAAAADFAGAFSLAARRLYSPAELSPGEREQIARFAIAAGKLDVVAGDLGGGAAAAKEDEEEKDDEAVSGTSDPESPGAVSVQVIYGCKGKVAQAEIVDKKGAQYDDYDFKSLPKNVCLSGFTASKPAPPDDPEGFDHFEDSYPTKAEQRRAKKEYERELASYQRTIEPKWDRFLATLDKTFGGSAYFVVTITPTDTGNKRLFVYHDQIAASCDPRGGCSFTLTGNNYVTPLPALRGDKPVTLWIAMTKSEYFSQEHGVMSADSIGTVERWLATRAKEHGSTMDTPDFKDPAGFSVERWYEVGPME